MYWSEPWWLLLWGLMPLPWVWERMRSRLGWPTLSVFEGSGGWASVGGWLPVLLRGLAIGFMALALARPQTVIGQVRIAGQGVAIMVVLDQSSSMQASDSRQASGQSLTRLEAAKETLAQFVAGRPDDLIGLVVFANYPDLACPPTLDHAFLIDMVRSVQPARPGDDGTNIGDAVAWALDALEKASPKKKVLILLTDGDNEPAVPKPLDPQEAARLAHRLGIVLHTIALGSAGGTVRSPESVTGLMVPFEVEGPNLLLLKEMAREGGGRMFTAIDAEGLRAVFQDIDRLEKSKLEGVVHTRYREWYPFWVAAAIGTLALDRLLLSGRLRQLP